MADAITIPARAKLNLALAVAPPLTGAANAGMHPVASWMTPIDLADTVRVARARADSSHTIRWHDGRPAGWPAESDLAVRAHRALEAVAGPLPADIEVVKRVPAGGGLGGGSSDAAAVLVALNALFALGTPHDELTAIAATLGSDVPFFLDRVDTPDAPPRPALVTGLGERIERFAAIDTAGRAILLACPPFGCPTGAVYRAFDDAPPPAFRDRDVAGLARAGRLDPAALFNDLAGPAERVEPRLAETRRRLASALGVPVHVSGSGSTLFALVPGERAQSACAAATRELPETVVQLVRLPYLARKESD